MGMASEFVRALRVAQGHDYNNCMHELALAENIIEIVTRCAQHEGFTRVGRVRVRVGPLAVVIPEALQAAFAAAKRGSPAETAVLVLESEPGQAWCRDCAATVVMNDALDACPCCQGYALRITGGNALRVIDIDGE